MGMDQYVCISGSMDQHVCVRVCMAQRPVSSTTRSSPPTPAARVPHASRVRPAVSRVA